MADPREHAPRTAGRTGGLPVEVVDLDIVVAARRDETTEPLIRALQRARARVRQLWPLPDILPGDTDVLVCELAPGLPNRVPWIPGEPKAALVVMIPGAPPPDLELLRNCAPDAVIHRPYVAEAVMTALVLARTRFAYEQRLRGRIEKLDETLRAIRSVERAKAILMSQQRIDEEAAYHFMRRQAMARRVSITAVAAAIVDAHEILD
jgi:AmiR/NasT family two-component response regulator